MSSTVLIDSINSLPLWAKITLPILCALIIWIWILILEVKGELR
jgi:hypothetical protein